jgi:CP family cyanate transporter-like MFS transporter
MQDGKAVEKRDGQATAIEAVPRLISSKTGLWTRPALVISLFLIGINLRSSFSSLGAVLPEVRHDFDLSAMGASLLTTMPIACLGLSGVLTPQLSRRFGIDRSMLILMLILALGTSLRGLGTLSALSAGALLAGVAIGVSNVLLPAIVKRDFPAETHAMMGLLTMALCLGAALAAALTLPIARILGGSWSGALASWALLCVPAVVLWRPQMRPEQRPVGKANLQSGTVWRSPLAWQVTVYMGLQSSLAYIIYGWLSPILRDRGMDGVDAGFIASLAIIMSLPGALFAPLLARFGRDQRAVAVAAVMMAAAGLIGCIFGPLSAAWLSAIVAGLGAGAAFAIALLFMVLRTRNTSQAASLSAMAQGVGYILASFGTLLIGPLHDLSADWTTTAAFIGCIGVIGAGAGLGAGRALVVELE